MDAALCALMILSRRKSRVNVLGGSEFTANKTRSNFIAREGALKMLLRALNQLSRLIRITIFVVFPRLLDLLHTDAQPLLAILRARSVYGSIDQFGESIEFTCRARVPFRRKIRTPQQYEIEDVRSSSL